MSASTEPRVAIVQDGAVINVVVAGLGFAQQHIAQAGQAAYDVVALPVSPGWNYDGDWLWNTHDANGDSCSYRIERDQNGVPVIGASGFANLIKQ